MRDRIRRPLGVSARTADRLQDLLQPGETLRYAFRAETKMNWKTLLLSMLARGAGNLTGGVLVVVTDRALLLADEVPQIVGEHDRVLHAELPLPYTFGPVSGSGWIHIDGQPVFVPGGRKVIEQAEAALRA
ncbi:MAG: hypothetical protein QOG43_922 [Actinomycetota bacterium]|nr:hypothetical protein [Actinomycetota bacterium]